MSIQDPRHTFSLACPHCHFEAIGSGTTQPSALNNAVFNIVAHVLSIHAPTAQELVARNPALIDALHEIDMLRAQLDEHEPQHMGAGGGVIDIEGALKRLTGRIDDLELWASNAVGRFKALEKLASRVNELELAAEAREGCRWSLMEPGKNPVNCTIVDAPHDVHSGNNGILNVAWHTNHPDARQRP